MDKFSTAFYRLPVRIAARQARLMGFAAGSPEHQLLEYRDKLNWDDFIKTLILLILSASVSLAQGTPAYLGCVVLLVCLYVPLHLFARGLHLTRFGPCLLLGTTYYMGCAALVPHMAPPLGFSLVVFTAAAWAVACYAPADGRHTSPQMLHKMRRTALLVLSAYTILFLLFHWAGLTLLAAALLCTVACQGIMLLPVTFRLAGQQHPRKGEKQNEPL